MKVVSRAIGTILIGDGAAALVRPRKYLKNLETGAPLLDDILDYFSEKPQLTRGISLVEISLGLWLLFR